MNTQIENSNNVNGNGNNDNMELDGGTVKHWLREMRIDRILATGVSHTRSRRAVVTTPVMASTDTPFIPEGVNPDDVIPGTGWTWADALDESLSRTRH